jgi:diaminopimelate epimerase
MKLNVAKVHNAGNSFIVCFNEQFKTTKTAIADLCNPGTGVGGDGFIFIENGETANEYNLRFFNNNGSGFKMCFNGTLCAALFLRRYQGSGNNISLHVTNFGFITVNFQEDAVVLTFRMPDVKIISRKIKHSGTTDICHYLFMTDNHKVILTDRSFFNSPSFVENASALRAKDHLFSQGANVHFASLYNNKVYIRHFEKGIEAETLSCGSGCIATALVLPERKKLEFISPGGKLNLQKMADGAWIMEGTPKIVSWLVFESNHALSRFKAAY